MEKTKSFKELTNMQLSTILKNSGHFKPATGKEKKYPKDELKQIYAEIFKIDVGEVDEMRFQEMGVKQGNIVYKPIDKAWKTLDSYNREFKEDKRTKPKQIDAASDYQRTEINNDDDLDSLHSSNANTPSNSRPTTPKGAAFKKSGISESEMKEMLIKEVVKKYGNDLKKTKPLEISDDQFWDDVFNDYAKELREKKEQQKLKTLQQIQAQLESKKSKLVILNKLNESANKLEEHYKSKEAKKEAKKLIQQEGPENAYEQKKLVDNTRKIAKSESKLFKERKSEMETEESKMAEKTAKLQKLRAIGHVIGKVAKNDYEQLEPIKQQVKDEKRQLRENERRLEAEEAKDFFKKKVQLPKEYGPKPFEGLKRSTYTEAPKQSEFKKVDKSNFAKTPTANVDVKKAFIDPNAVKTTEKAIKKDEDELQKKIFNRSRGIKFNHSREHVLKTLKSWL